MILGLIFFVVFCNPVAATGVMALTKPDTTAKVRLVENYGKVNCLDEKLEIEIGKGVCDELERY